MDEWSNAPHAWCYLRKPIDAIDLNILQALLRDARMSNRDLAGVIGLSDSACLARVRALEAAGVIVGYRATLAFEQVGAFHCWADVALVDDESVTIAAFEHFVAAEREIVGGYIMEGEFQFRLEIVTSTYAGWRELSGRMLAFGGLVDRVKRGAIYKICRTHHGV